MPKIVPFLSYAHEDKDLVRKLYDHLERAGFYPWFDQERLLPGQMWRAAIGKAIQESDFFIACLSQNSVNKRGFVQKELKHALDLVGEFPDEQVFLIPVKLAECQIPASLQPYHCVSIEDSDGIPKLISTLKSAYLERNPLPEPSLHVQGTKWPHGEAYFNRIAVPHSNLIKRMEGPSGGTTVEVRGSGDNDTQLWFLSDPKGGEMSLLFETHLVLGTVLVSEDSSCIAADFGSASYGRYPIVFFMRDSGRFRASDTDIAGECWRTMSKLLGVPENSAPNHLYCNLESIATKPIAVTLLLSGDYQNAGETRRIPPSRAIYSFKQNAVVDVTAIQGIEGT